MPSDPPPSSKSGPRLPRKFGSYLLFDRIGAGGMAEIFLARARTELGGQRRVVVKQILPSLAAHPQFAEMLIHEAKLAAKLDHANIAQVYDLGRSDEQLFIAMEYVEGFDLNDLLRRCSKQKIAVPIELALAILSDTLRGLDYAHRRTADDGTSLGIVHRDVSPSNVLVSFEGEVKLCDFGIAHANDVVGAGLTSQTEEALRGKAGYMSPEHARGEPVDARADVFAVGILLWELLSGRRMYRQVDGGPTLLEQARRGEMPPLTAKGLPSEELLHEIATKALAPRRDDRFPSASAMLREIDRYLGEAGLIVSPIRLGDWLVASLGSEIVLERRRRQRAAEALELGPPVRLTPLPFVPEPPQVTPIAPPMAMKAAFAVSSAIAAPAAPAVVEAPRASPPLSIAAPPPSSMLTAVELPPRSLRSASRIPWTFVALALLVGSIFIMLTRHP